MTAANPVTTIQPDRVKICGHTSIIDAFSKLISRIADNIGVSGNASAMYGNIHGNDAVEKKVPAKKTIGSAMAFPIPDAADGLLAQADIKKPMLRNTALPSKITRINPIQSPDNLAPNTRIPTPNMIIAWTRANARWAMISEAKYFQIGRGVTSKRLSIDWLR